MKQNVNLNDIFKHKFISKMKLNGTKSHLAFIVNKANKNENKYDSNLYVMDSKLNTIM